MKKIILLILIFAVLVQLELFPAIIDSMDSTSGWSTQSADNAVIVLSTTFGYTGNANLITYDITNGNWCQIYKRIDNSDWSSGDSVKIHYKGSGNSNNIELKLYDSDGDIAATTPTGVTNTSDNWTSAVIPFSSFALWKDANNNPYGNGTINNGSISKLGFGITKNEGGSGTLCLDKIELYRQTTPTNILLDSCDNGTNARGNASTTGGWNGGAINKDVVSGYKESCYKIDYSVPFSNSGAVMEEGLVVSGSSMNVSGTNYLTLYLKGKDGGERFKLELWYWDPKASTEKNAIVTIDDIKQVSSQWQLYSIPLTMFGTFVNYKAYLTKFKIVFDGGYTPGDYGTIYVDEIRFSDSSDPEIGIGPVKTIDELEGPFNSLTYPASVDGNAVYSVSAVAGTSGNAMQVTYDFKSGSWIVFEHTTGLNISQDKGFRFRYKGSGNMNNVEFKIEDLDGVVFWKKFFNFTNTNGTWKTVEVLNNELVLFSIGPKNNDSLDLKNLKQVYLAISKSSGGSGTLAIDELETITVADLTKKREKKIISEISVDNNPFSPNNDGIKDKAVFGYTLSDYAEVTLEIYNLSGILLRKIPHHWQSAGSHNLSWEGEDDSGKTVPNGIFIFKLKAKNIDGKSDDIKNVIGVFR